MSVFIEFLGFAVYLISILLYGLFFETAPQAQNLTYYFQGDVFLGIVGLYCLGFAGPLWMLSATVREFRKADRSKLNKNLLLNALWSGIVFPGLGCLIWFLKGDIGLAIVWLGLAWSAVFAGHLLYVLLIALFYKPGKKPNF
jgi:hypothetical protein